MNSLGELLVYGNSWFTCSHCQQFPVSSKVKFDIVLLSIHCHRFQTFDLINDITQGILHCLILLWLLTQLADTEGEIDLTKWAFLESSSIAQ